MARESEEARWISAEHAVEIAERSSPVSASLFPDSPPSVAAYIDDDDAFVDSLRYVHSAWIALYSFLTSGQPSG